MREASLHAMTCYLQKVMLHIKFARWMNPPFEREKATLAAWWTMHHARCSAIQVPARLLMPLASSKMRSEREPEKESIAWLC